MVKMTVFSDRRYREKWIALKDDQKTVVAVASSPREALKESRTKGMENPIVTRIPKDNSGYIL